MKNIFLIMAFAVLMWSCNSSDKKHNTTKTSTELETSIERGTLVYNDLCVTCHLPNGKGIPKSFPPLANSDFLMNNRTQSIKAIKYGLSGKITVNGEPYNMPMAALGLTNTEIADVMNYITNTWGNQNSSLITVEEVSEIKP